MKCAIYLQIRKENPDITIPMEKITIKKGRKIEVFDKPNEVVIEVPSYADVSDGYHTIEELYDHRITLFIALCREYDKFSESRGFSGTVWRSKRHHDGTGYDGWFLLAIEREPGKQITYHIPLSRWDETFFAETYENAPVPFDGHTSADVLKRLKHL